MFDCIDCPICGCKDFSLVWAGPHVKAVCKSCEEVYKNRQSMVQFVQQSEDFDLRSGYEKATDKQVKYLKSLIYSCGELLPKESAGEMITLLKKINESK